MKLPNGFGSVYKLKGKRRRPYIARITSHMEFDEETKKYKQVQKALGYYRTRAEALEALAAYNKNPFNLDSLTTTFEEVYNMLTFTEGSEKNYKAAYRYLEPIKDMPLRNIKASHMQECIDSCTTTQQALIKSLCRKVFQHAVKNEIIDRNPTEYLTAVTPKAKIERKMFTHEEIDDLWTMTDLWWVKVTLMLLYSGMRTKELRFVPVENIDLNNRWLELAAAKNECSVRGLPIHERTVPLFADYIKKGGNLYGWSHGYLNKHLWDFHGHRAHDTRHTFTTRLHELGTDDLVIKRLLGHTPNDITARVYTHISQDELQNALSKLDY